MTNTQTTHITIDERVPLSQTKLWDAQRHYYQSQGIQAWAHHVPYYVTSNPYFANSYASIIVRYIQDQMIKGVINTDEPVYIVELGAGSGTFSFYFLKIFTELVSALSVTVSTVYVMTDIITENLSLIHI